MLATHDLKKMGPVFALVVGWGIFVFSVLSSFFTEDMSSAVVFPSLPTVSQTGPFANPVLPAVFKTLNLFGNAAATNGGPIDAPTTQLALTLKGVLTETKDSQGSVIIVDAQQVEAVYHAGDTLPGPAVLREIYADRVILEYMGRLETLWLYDRNAPSLFPVVEQK